MSYIQAVSSADVAQLEGLLLGRPTPDPSVHLLESVGLAGYVAGRDASRAAPELRSALLGASARHISIRREVLRLVEAWQQAGVEVLLFKGFHLAEFVYDSPGQRLYSDVDLLIREADAPTVSAIAQTHGWQEAWSVEQASALHSYRLPGYQGHGVLHLVHSRLGVELDIHRRLVHNNHDQIGRYEMQARITELAWAAARPVAWDGVRIMELDPVDAVLVGLVLSRTWSNDEWDLRPHDYLDFSLLVERYGLLRSQLHDRARQLGCSRTFELFLERCDPFRGRLRLGAPARLTRQYWNLLLAGERGNRYAQRSLVSLARFLVAPYQIASQLPLALQVVRLARREPDLNRLAVRFETPENLTGSLTGPQLRSIRIGLHRALRLLGRAGPGDRDIETVALLAALHRRACPARVVRAAEGEERRLQLELGEWAHRKEPAANRRPGFDSGTPRQVR